MTDCAAGPCKEPRIDGSMFCPKHGPKSAWGQPKKPPAVANGEAQLVCPHCQIKGKVTSRLIKTKNGISGGKATGAILTGGISLLGTGLSRKATVTEMTCSNCKTVWHVA